MKTMLDSFQQKYPNLSFDFQTSPPVKDYIAKLQTMLLSDSATDIFVIAAENRNEVIDGGYALDLTDEPFMDGMLDSNKPMLSKNGKTYAYTQTGWVGGIFYNKELFKKAGIDKFPETWDDFIAVCKKLKEAGIIPIYDNIGDMPMLLDGLYANITLSKDPQFDEKIFSGKATFEQGWTEALKHWNEIVTNKIITPDMIGLTADQIVNEFATGNVAMIQGGPWNIQTLKQSNPDLQFEMAPIPAVNPGEKWYAGAPGVGLAINSKTKHKDQALQFLSYVASQEGLKKFEEGSGAIIVAKGYESKVDPSIETAYKEGLLKGKVYLPMVSWPRHQEALRNQMVVSLQDLVVGKGTPEGVAQSLDKKLKEMDNE